MQVVFKNEQALNADSDDDQDKSRKLKGAARGCLRGRAAAVVGTSPYL